MENNGLEYLDRYDKQHLSPTIASLNDRKQLNLDLSRIKHGNFGDKHFLANNILNCKKTAKNTDLARYPDLSHVLRLTNILKIDGISFKSTIDDLQYISELGHGSCGYVVKMLHKNSGKMMAVKQMLRSSDPDEARRILMDLDVVLRSLNCAYIVQCYGCLVTHTHVHICIELMNECLGKLLKRIRPQTVPEPIVGKITVAILKALSYLKHVHGIIHRDVKPSNILLDCYGNVKLCDFGISGHLVNSKAKTRTAGSAAYMAPERIEPPDVTCPDYDIRADVWSMGITLVELATGVLPYSECNSEFEALTMVLRCDPPSIPSDMGYSPEFRSFVGVCLVKNYRLRPKYRRLLEHEFVVKSENMRVDVIGWYSDICAATSNSCNNAIAQSTDSTFLSVNTGFNGSDSESPSTPIVLRRNYVPIRRYNSAQAVHSHNYNVCSDYVRGRNFSSRNIAGNGPSFSASRCHVSVRQRCANDLTHYYTPQLSRRSLDYTQSRYHDNIVVRGVEQDMYPQLM